mmetsp:Transcript_4121/g.13813  ORF Transcript_4121/g.13813 Transcript_4121/m.13813 type:complete len:351 (+) Transcript_4121:46-1098(+)
MLGRSRGLRGFRRLSTASGVRASTTSPAMEWFESQLDRGFAYGNQPDLAEMSVTGRRLQEAGDLEGAASLIGEAVSSFKARLGPQHPDTLTSMSNLGSLLQTLGDHTSASDQYCKVVAGRRACFGDEHPATLAALNQLGVCLARDLCCLDGGAPALREALAGRRSTLGARHPDTLCSIRNVGALLYAFGNLQGAAPLYREALAGCREVYGRNDPHTVRSALAFGLLLKAWGRANAEAEACLEEALAGCRATGPWPLAGCPATFLALSSLAELLEARGELQAALPLLAESVECAAVYYGAHHEETQQCAAAFMRLLQRVGRSDQAETVRGDYDVSEYRVSPSPWSKVSGEA